VDSLTLPRLDRAIPLQRASASAEAFFLAELNRRCERGHLVETGRTTTAHAAMEATLRRFFNPRGGLSERFIKLAVVLDDQAHYDESSDMMEGEIAWALFPADTIHWANVGKAIAHLEGLKRGAGETVLHAIEEVANSVDGILTPSAARDLAAMMYWDEARSDDEAGLALQDRGYDGDSEDEGPMLPSQFSKAAGGPLWMSPKRKLGYRALRNALSPLGTEVAAKLSGLAGTLLPRASKACRKALGIAPSERSWASFSVGVLNGNPAAGNFVGRLFDDIDNDRANSGASDVLYRCSTAPTIGRPRRASSAKPRTGDGLAMLAGRLWAYHYLDLMLGLLVDLQDSLPDTGEGDFQCT